MITLIGLIASLMFIVSSIAQMIKCVEQGHAHGLSHTTIWALNIGLSGTLIYTYKLLGFDWILHGGYGLQLACWILITKYRYFPTTKL